MTSHEFIHHSQQFITEVESIVCPFCNHIYRSTLLKLLHIDNDIYYLTEQCNNSTCYKRSIIKKEYDRAQIKTGPIPKSIYKGKTFIVPQKGILTINKLIIDKLDSETKMLYTNACNSITINASAMYLRQCLEAYLAYNHKLIENNLEFKLNQLNKIFEKDNILRGLIISILKPIKNICNSGIHYDKTFNIKKLYKAKSAIDIFFKRIYIEKPEIDRLESEEK